MLKFCTRVLRLKIALWRYKSELDPSGTLHIGPMADDWRDCMGFGNGNTIDVIDVHGVLLACVQELTAKVAELEQGLRFLNGERTNDERNDATDCGGTDLQAGAKSGGRGRLN